jgi:N-acetylglucosamine malate deacetylase 2
MERHVLVVLPHPDDETFGAGGVIAFYTKQGVPVTYVCATLGQMGRNMGKPFFANRETLPAVREKELRDACRVLGCDLRLLGLRDKTLEFEDPEVLADKIEAIIHELKPSLVITHYPGHGVHPDHNALGEATVRAVLRIPEAERPKLHCHAFTHNRIEELGEPDVVVDIADVLDIKLEATRAHRSQSEAMLASLEAQMAESPEVRDRIMKERSREVYWTYKGHH